MKHFITPGLQYVLQRLPGRPHPPFFVNEKFNIVNEQPESGWLYGHDDQYDYSIYRIKGGKIVGVCRDDDASEAEDDDVVEYINPTRTEG